MRAFSLSILLLLGVVCTPLLAQSSPLDEKQKAVMLFDIRMDLITGSKIGKSLGLVEQMGNMQMQGAAGEDAPDMTKAVRLFGAMSAPESLQEAQTMGAGPLPIEFFARIQFSDSSEVTKMMDMAKGKNGGTVENNGKTYYKPPENGEGEGPEGILMHALNETTLEMGTEAYLFGGSATPFTDGLNTARANLPKDQAIRLVLDLEGAESLIAEAVEMGKAQASDPLTKAYLDVVDNIKNLRIAIDLSSANLLTLQATGKNSEEAEEFKESLDSLLATAQAMGGMGVQQLKQMDPAAGGVAKDLLDSLKATIDGNEVSVTIPKPNKFDEAIINAVENFGGMMMGGGPGGPPPSR